MKKPLCLKWTNPHLLQPLLSTVMVVLAGCGGGGITSSAKTQITPLNDTGITSSQCFGEGSDTLVSCTSTEATSLNTQQDGMVGRDVNNPDNSDGNLGFSYSEVPKADGTGNYLRTECVKDNITGLMWEGKPATGTRGNPSLNPSVKYTNYAMGYTDGNNTAVTQPQVDAITNAKGYVNAVNAVGLCGYTDWRLPTPSELQSIVDYGVSSGPTIDGNWFPNTQDNVYWTSSPYVGSSDKVWVVDFYTGNVYIAPDGRRSIFYVRLVR